MKKLLGIGTIAVFLLTACQNGKVSPCLGTIVSFQTQAEQYTAKATQYADSAVQATKAKNYPAAVLYGAQSAQFAASAKQAVDSALYYTKNCPDSTK